MSSSQNAQLSQQYQKKTDKQHILDAPDTYIGSIEPGEQLVNIMTQDSSVESTKTYTIINGLYKLFDESIVNARDHATRMQGKKDKDNYPVTYIDVGISEDGILTFVNDGNGIDIVKHPEYNEWIPEMIFGHLRNCWRKERLWSQACIYLVGMGDGGDDRPYSWS